MKTERAIGISKKYDDNQETKKAISQSTLDVMFWMLEESNSDSLKKQGTKILMTHFDSLEEAIKYRSELESAQFTLDHLFAKFPESRELAGLS